MDAENKQQLLILMQRHGIVELDYTDNNRAISLSLAPEVGATIRSPGIGIFCANHPMSKNQKQINGRIRKGELIGFLKNVPLLRPVIAEEDCHIRVAKVVDGTLVGYGDALYDIV